MGFLLRICTAINKRGPRVLNSEKEKPYFHPQHRPLTVNQDFGDTSLPTLGWGKQSTWLAASGSLAHLRARPAPTPGREVDTTGRPLSRPCRPCVPLSGRGRVNTQGSPISGGVFSTCGRCFLKSRQAECSHENSEKERLRGSPVSGPLGAFDFRTRIKDRRR